MNRIEAMTINEIKKLRAAITRPPWTLTEENFIVGKNGPAVAEIDCYGGGPPANATFLTKAPDIIDFLFTDREELVKERDEWQRKHAELKQIAQNGLTDTSGLAENLFYQKDTDMKLAKEGLVRQIIVAVRARREPDEVHMVDHNIGIEEAIEAIERVATKLGISISEN